MAEDTIRIGIVGAGNKTCESHLPNLQGIEGVEVIGVGNRSQSSSQSVADRFQIKKTYTHWRQAVEDSETDAILIGTWPNLHCPVTLAALDAGKHVLCEARMALNADEARQMAQAAERRPDLVTHLVPAPFTFGVDDAITNLLAQGYLGRILAIDMRLSSGRFIETEAPLNWRENADFSGNNLMMVGIWYESLMRWVGGARQVSAMGRTFVKSRLDEDGEMCSIRIPDHLDVSAEMDCGAQLHIQSSRVCGLTAPDCVTLYGSEGTLSTTGDRLFGGQRTDTELDEIPIPEGDRNHWRVEEEFINAIRGLETIQLTRFQDGLKYMEFTDAIAHSMASGHRVALPL